MKKLNKMTRYLVPTAAAIGMLLATSPASALENFYLAAKAYDKTLLGGTVVPMWGYVEDTGGTCFNLTSAALRLDCVNNTLPDPSSPGPQLSVPPGESDVRVRLTNGLSEPTSIIISGQKMPWSNSNNGPTWNDGSAGSRTTPSQRVRSFGREASANGGKRAYVWRDTRGTSFDRPGSFIYHSGTHPQKQVYMGLAGLITKDQSAGEAYPGVSYDDDVVLFYSDIDPQFNEAVKAGTLSTAMDRHPTWFLVNGEPYEAGMGDITNGTSGPLTASTNTLLRLASTATEAHVVVLQGMNMKIHAEDGLQYNYQDAGGSYAAPRTQYSAVLPPIMTKDAVIVAPENGRFAVYDGDGYMTNPSDPAVETVGDEVGGMLRFLSFGAGAGNLAPSALNDIASVVSGFPVSISVLSNDTDPEGDSLNIASSDTFGTAGGTISCTYGVPGGTCLYDSGTLLAGTMDTFTYIANDGSSNSGSATVTVTVTANQVPTANNDAASTDQDVAVVIDVAANDTDPEGQSLTVNNFDASSTAGQTVSCVASNCTYTPTLGFTGSDSFTYTVSDGVNTSAPATVDVTVNPANLAPTAVDDPDEVTNINTQLVIDVLANDTDPEFGDLLIATSDTASVNGGTVTCVSGVVGGTCTYTPANGFTGSDTFTYTASDGVNTSNTATVTVNVSGVGAAALYFSTVGAGSIPGVAGPYDDGDIYTSDASSILDRLYDAIVDLGLPSNADIDGLSVDGDTLYISFAGASTSVTGLGNVPDEDVVTYNTVSETWGAYFDGSLCGLDSNNGQDIDAVSVSGGTLYFSIVGGGNRNPVGGVAGSYDDADVYAWNGGTAGSTNCTRVLDGSASGLPGNADIDGLTVAGGDYYISFNRNGGTNVSGIGTVQDEAIVRFNGTWSAVPLGTDGLSSSNAQDVDAIHIP
ncbi:MAG: tandem-95 repeat protein [Gammaproteobacteria bacterium]|nr:tandem-95 repeat protein [Gammaproteobacteria bacterium]